MINSTKIFEYDGRASTKANFPPGIINATLSNDMYEFATLGAKTIVEQKIQGRDIPYFYNVDYDTLSFGMTIAFEDYATKAQVNEVIKWLYSPSTPRLLKFPEYGMNYFGLFIGQPTFYYVGNNHSGFKYIGYIEVEFRANAPYGWTDLIEQTATGNHVVNNTGDIEILPSFTLTNLVSTPDTTNTVTITANSKSFTYVMGPGEELTFNGYTKILSSETDPNPYASWTTKDYIEFLPGNNSVTMSSQASITYKFRAPKIL